MTPSGSRPSLPQRMPASLPYNDLNGREATEILVDWFRQLLRGHYLMQPHLTLPMAVFDLQVHIGVDMYVGGSVPVAATPDHIDIQGSVKLTNEIPSGGGATASNDRKVVVASHMQHTEHDFAATVNAAPVPGGLPPDQVREQHRLPVPRPGYGSRDTGSHLFLADIFEGPSEVELKQALLDNGKASPPAALDTTGGRRGDVAEGYVFSSEPVMHDSHQTISTAI